MCDWIPERVLLAQRSPETPRANPDRWCRKRLPPSGKQLQTYMVLARTCEADLVAHRRYSCGHPDLARSKEGVQRFRGELWTTRVPESPAWKLSNLAGNAAASLGKPA